MSQQEHTALQFQMTGEYPNTDANYNQPLNYYNPHNPYSQYPNTDNQYPNTNNQYPNTNNQYPNTDYQYPNTDSQYPDTAAQYPNTQCTAPNYPSQHTATPRYPHLNTNPMATIQNRNGSGTTEAAKNKHVHDLASNQVQEIKKSDESKVVSDGLALIGDYGDDD